MEDRGDRTEHVDVQFDSIDAAGIDRFANHLRFETQSKPVHPEGTVVDIFNSTRNLSSRGSPRLGGLSRNSREIRDFLSVCAWVAVGPPCFRYGELHRKEYDGTSCSWGACVGQVGDALPGARTRFSRHGSLLATPPSPFGGRGVGQAEYPRGRAQAFGVVSSGPER